jgi:hypothetical protein
MTQRCVAPDLGGARRQRRHIVNNGLRGSACLPVWALKQRWARIRPESPAHVMKAGDHGHTNDIVDPWAMHLARSGWSASEQRSSA